jgi:hypothetical protein
MPTDSLENNLAKFKRVLLIWVGAVATLLAVAIGDIPNSHSPCFPGWYGVWIVVQVGTITPAIMLLFGSGFGRLPLPERLNPLFAYLFVRWIALVACVIEFVCMDSFACSRQLFLALIPIFYCPPNNLTKFCIGYLADI